MKLNSRIDACYTVTVKIWKLKYFSLQKMRFTFKNIQIIVSKFKEFCIR